MKEQDFLRRFLFDDANVRGVWVNLSAAWQEAKAHQHGSKLAIHTLGEALAAVSMLSAMIKFEGSLILQAQGDGDVKTLVAQANNDRQIRGLVRCEGVVTQGDLEALFGQGRLVLTIDAGGSHPYQGVVPLQGRHLANALEVYFLQSEQLKTRLWLFADEQHAAGLLLQELPAEQTKGDDWQRIEMLANTITEQEMLSLDCETLLYRLFHEEVVRVFDAEALSFQCACSKPRIERTLQAMGREELDDLLATLGMIEVGCEFCGRHYQFDKIDVELLFKDTANSSNRVH